MSTLAVRAKLTLGLHDYCDSGTASWPLQSEGVNLLGADVAGEDRGAVRSDADFGIPRRAGGTVQAFQARDRFHPAIRQSNIPEHGVCAAGDVVHRLVVRRVDPIDDVAGGRERNQLGPLLRPDIKNHQLREVLRASDQPVVAHPLRIQQPSRSGN